jgi:hypothetical protein
MIRSWLGHAPIEATNAYVEIDFEMRRKKPKKGKHDPPWQRDGGILSWLSKL